MATSAAQLPTGEAIFLDHVGHFVDDPSAASQALANAGFTTTPVSIQTNPDPNGGPPRLTGTGNVCAMLPNGYLEVLFKTADTPLGAEFDQSKTRYSGLHLAAFAIADPQAAHARLERAGFSMQPIVSMQRPVGTANGEGIAAFQIVRLAPGQMPEGRVQMLRHITEETVWQRRWLTHPNGALALSALTIVVADVDEAADRFSRFTGRASSPHPLGLSIRFDRGELIFCSTAAWQQRWPHSAVPSLPFMGECRITVEDIGTTRRMLAARSITPLNDSDTSLSVAFPAALGHGIWTFEQAPPPTG